MPSILREIKIPSKANIKKEVDIEWNAPLRSKHLNVWNHPAQVYLAIFLAKIINGKFHETK